MGERVKVIKKIHKSREYIIEENMNDIKSRLSDRKIAMEKGRFRLNGQFKPNGK